MPRRRGSVAVLAAPPVSPVQLLGVLSYAAPLLSTLLTIAPSLSIVLVHGYGGSQLGTWTDANNVCWPTRREYWGEMADKIRVLAFGYNASFLANVTTNSVHDNASDLLEGLRILRAEVQVRYH